MRGIGLECLPRSVKRFSEKKHGKQKASTAVKRWANARGALKGVAAFGSRRAALGNGGTQKWAAARAVDRRCGPRVIWSLILSGGFPILEQIRNINGAVVRAAAPKEGGQMPANAAAASWSG